MFAGWLVPCLFVSFLSHGHSARIARINRTVGEINRISKQWQLSSWMTNLYSEIQDRPFNQLWIPGTHDAFTEDSSDILTDGPDCDANILKADKFLPGKTVSDVVNLWARVQTRSIGWQLDHGIRYFDLRPFTKDGIHFYFQHCTRTNMQVQEFFQKYYYPFLARANMKEVIILGFHSFLTSGKRSWPVNWHKAFMKLIIQNLPSGSLIDTSRISMSSTLSQITSSGTKAGSKVMMIYNSGQHPPQVGDTTVRNRFFGGSARSRRWCDVRSVGAMISCADQEISERPVNGLLSIEGQLTPDGDTVVDWLKGFVSRINFMPQLWSYNLKWQDEQGGPVNARLMETINHKWKAALGTKGFAVLMDNPHDTDINYLVSLNAHGARAAHFQAFTYGGCSANWAWFKGCKDMPNACSNGGNPFSFAHNGGCRCWCQMNGGRDFGCRNNGYGTWCE